MSDDFVNFCLAFVALVVVAAGLSQCATDDIYDDGCPDDYVELCGP